MITSQQPKIRKLTNWSIKKERLSNSQKLIFGASEWIILTGQREDQQWSTSFITHAYNPTTILSYTNTIYILESFNKQKTHRNNLSYSFCEIFVSGFPIDWLNLVQKEVGVTRSDILSVAGIIIPVFKDKLDSVQNRSKIAGLKQVDLRKSQKVLELPDDELISPSKPTKPIKNQNVLEIPDDELISPKKPTLLESQLESTIKSPKVVLNKNDLKSRNLGGKSAQKRKFSTKKSKLNEAFDSDSGKRLKKQARKVSSDFDSEIESKYKLKKQRTSTTILDSESESDSKVKSKKQVRKSTTISLSSDSENNKDPNRQSDKKTAFKKQTRKLSDINRTASSDIPLKTRSGRVVKAPMDWWNADVLAEDIARRWSNGAMNIKQDGGKDDDAIETVKEHEEDNVVDIGLKPLKNQVVEACEKVHVDQVENAGNLSLDSEFAHEKIDSSRNCDKANDIKIKDNANDIEKSQNSNGEQDKASLDLVAKEDIPDDEYSIISNESIDLLSGIVYGKALFSEIDFGVDLDESIFSMVEEI